MRRRPWVVSTRKTRWTVEQIRAELDRFESRYGVSSENRLDAFDEVERCDSDDLQRWSALYRMWQREQQHTSG